MLDSSAEPESWSPTIRPLPAEWLGDLERFIQHAEVNIWMVSLEPPVPTALPTDEQIRLILSRSVIRHTTIDNLRSLGLTRPEELLDRYVSDFRFGDDPDLEDSLRAFVRQGYRLRGARGISRHSERGTMHFLDDWLGIVRDGHLIRLWGLRRDVTDEVRLQERLKEAVESEHVEIVGRSRALTQVLAEVEQVAPADATVLLTGETGTGKEVIARAIHRRSGRSAGPWIAVNCGAISAGLVESELFGHERGAFTGALARRIGRFEQAHGGTIFLDEIGDLAPELQTRLLRVLQEGEVERVGGSGRPIPVNVRVIAATHRDLPAAVAAGTFRADLFYRLNVFPIHCPALRERPEDIPVLASHFVQRFAARQGKRITESWPTSSNAR